ncbi:uncharacterized protein [Argopecten irradians]|uniref:uncharacterized protein isoform X2 n=1 Tax=Argopecten irradians TaxID=31199 RepID=UPI003722A67C
MHLFLTTLTVLLPGLIYAVPINRESFGLRCDREVSPKGDNYFVLLVFNTKIDMPCPPGTLYNKAVCDCDLPPVGQTTSKPTVTPTQSTAKLNNVMTVAPEQTSEEKIITSTSVKPTTETTTSVTSTTTTPTTTEMKTTTTPTTTMKPTTLPTTTTTTTTTTAPTPTITTTTTMKSTSKTTITSTTPKPTTTYKTTEPTKATTTVAPTTESTTPVTVPPSTDTTGVFTDPTSTPVTTDTVCRSRRQGTGYVEDTPGIGKVWHSCGKDQLFLNAACKCVPKDQMTETEPTTKDMITSTTASPTTTAATTISESTTQDNTARCNDRIKEANGFKEYNIVIMDWVFYECSPSWVFSLSHCDCVDPGTNPVPPRGPPKDCSNFEIKGTGYIEHIANFGAVYHNCPPNQIFSMRVCDCTGGGSEHTDGHTRTDTIRLTDANKVDCSFEAQGDGYIENVPGVGDVYYTCANNHRFVNGLCRCIDKGITVIDETNNNPKTTLSPTATSNRADLTTITFLATTTSINDGFQCKNRKKSGHGYLEYFESLSDWVFFGCSTRQEFSITECDCVTKGGNVAIPKPTTDCNLEARGNGFVEYIPGLGDVYSDCPPSQLFYSSLCACGAIGSGKNDIVITITDQNRVQNCAFEERGDGFVEHVVGLGLVYHDCSGSERFVSALCKCIDKDTKIIDNSSPSRTTTTPKSTAASTAATTDQTTTRPEFSTVPPTSTASPPSSTGTVITNKDCIYEQVPGARREFRTPMAWMPGQYMYFSCNIGQEFDITACSCVDEKVTTTQPTINPDCPFLPSAIGDNYFRFLLFGIGWVEFSCATGQRYDYSMCLCVRRT